jgi:hypothetical protein
MPYFLRISIIFAAFYAVNMPSIHRTVYQSPILYASINLPYTPPKKTNTATAFTEAPVAESIKAEFTEATSLKTNTAAEFIEASHLNSISGNPPD